MAVVVVTWRVVLAVPLAVRRTGFCPPMTAMNPNGTVAVRVTFPAKLFRLVTITLTVLVEPAMLIVAEGSR